ncbi:MAG: ABC transporter substrate-binding protein [Candidatus Pacearchaeota archaeon]
MVPIIALLLCLFLVSSIFVAGCAKKEKEEVIKIGAILPLTGNVAFWGQPVQKGMEFAAKEINSKGGINGKKIELRIEDSKGDATEGVIALNKLLNIDKVLTVSVHTTAVSNAVAPILEENKVPWIANAADPGLPLTYKYAFKTFYNAYDECKKLIMDLKKE